MYCSWARALNGTSEKDEAFDGNGFHPMLYRICLRWRPMACRKQDARLWVKSKGLPGVMPPGQGIMRACRYQEAVTATRSAFQYLHQAIEAHGYNRAGTQPERHIIKEAGF
jgi:hypothetical protein